MNFRNSAANRLFLTVVALLFTTALFSGTAFSVGPRVGSNAPDFELSDLNGTKVTLSGFKDKKPVLVYFWASWCPYCMAVRPDVIKLRKTVPENDLAVLGVNVGGGDSLAKVKAFEEKNPAPYTVLYDADGKAARLFGVMGIPHFVVIDKSGVVKYSGNEFPKDTMALLK